MNGNSMPRWAAARAARSTPTGKLPRIRPYGAAQIRNAAIIINVGADLKLPPRGWVIAVATAMQESRPDQPRQSRRRATTTTRSACSSSGRAPAGARPSRSWTRSTRARKFYEKLVKVAGWETMPLTEAAQRVQVSAYPDAYAKHETAGHADREHCSPTAPPTRSATRSAMVCAAGRSDRRLRLDHPGQGVRRLRFPHRRPGPRTRVSTSSSAAYTPIHAAASGVVSVVKCDEDHSGRLDCNVDGYPGKGGCGWMVEILHAGDVITRYCHMVSAAVRQIGQIVTAGEVIGRVGTSGNSSGPHLHFEVHLNNDRQRPARSTRCRSWRAGGRAAGRPGMTGGPCPIRSPASRTGHREPPRPIVPTPATMAGRATRPAGAHRAARPRLARRPARRRDGGAGQPDLRAGDARARVVPRRSRADRGVRAAGAGGTGLGGGYGLSRASRPRALTRCPAGVARRAAATYPVAGTGRGRAHRSAGRAAARGRRRAPRPASRHRTAHEDAGDICVRVAPSWTGTAGPGAVECPERWRSRCICSGRNSGYASGRAPQTRQPS